MAIARSSPTSSFMAAAVASQASCLRLDTTTFAPAMASPSARARPIPLDEPVVRATLPDKSNSVGLLIGHTLRFFRKYAIAMTTQVPDRRGGLTAIPDEALRVSFVHARGPGGQNVNKVATAVELRMHVAASQLPLAVQERLRQLAGQRLNNRDEIVLFAQESRSQLRNRSLALLRLGELIRQAKVRPKRRIATRPSKAAKRRRLDNKKRRGSIKQQRSRPSLD